jgi:N-acetyl sugar amidotransferase
MSEKSYQICTKTIMDTSDPEISFDENGVCNYVNEFNLSVKADLENKEQKKKNLESLLLKIKEDGKNKEYDCIIGLSGGVDSCYLAYLVKNQFGLRPLAIHVDGGWNSELAVKNVEHIVKKLGIDLHTFVVDWSEMKDIQVAFFKAAVANQDVPQDHAFFAALNKEASKRGIKYIINGSNKATEYILPNSWGYNAMDARHIKSIHKKFGKRRIKNFPIVSFLEYYIYYPFIKGIRIVKPLNYIDYIKADAMNVLEKDLGWRYYGGKHYESRFTKFFQSYFLPTKFGYDKRKAHLSSLIVSGQTTREKALEEITKPLYDEVELQEDKEYVLKKLGITSDEWDNIMELPNKTYKDYPSNYSKYIILRKLKDKFLPRFSS